MGKVSLMGRNRLSAMMAYACKAKHAGRNNTMGNVQTNGVLVSLPAQEPTLRLRHGPRAWASTRAKPG